MRPRQRFGAAERWWLSLAGVSLRPLPTATHHVISVQAVHRGSSWCQSGMEGCSSTPNGVTPAWSDGPVAVCDDIGTDTRRIRYPGASQAATGSPGHLGYW